MLNQPGGSLPDILAEPWNKGSFRICPILGKELSLCLHRHKKTTERTGFGSRSPPQTPLRTVRSADSMRIGPIFRPKHSIIKLGGFFNVLQWIFQCSPGLLCTLVSKTPPNVEKFARFPCSTTSPKRAFWHCKPCPKPSPKPKTSADP